MPPALPSIVQRRPHRGLVCLLLFALLALQGLGQAHRAWHALPQAHAAAALAAGDEDAFGHQRQGEECRLFDQLLLADLAFAGPSVSPAPPAAPVRMHRPAAAARAEARLAYRARAPPLNGA